VTDDEPVQPVEIASITADHEPDGSTVQITITFDSGPDRDPLRSELAHRIQRIVHSRIMGSGPDGHVSIQLPRDGIEEGVRAIYRAVAEFNDVYPSLLAEHRQQLVVARVSSSVYPSAMRTGR
jgi:D-serine deaminase-like pyridoxal phosphate-dependent protein